MDGNVIGDEASGQIRSQSVTRLATGGTFTLAGAFASGGLGFLVTVAITRGLPSVSQAGAFFGALALFNILIRLAQLGAGTGVIRFFALRLATGRAAELRPLLSIATLPVLAFSTMLAVALALLAELAATTFASAGSVADFAAYVRAFAAFLPAATLLNIMLGASRGFGSMRPTVYLEDLLRPALQLALVALVLTYASDPVPLSLAYWSSTALAALLAYRWVRRRIASCGATARTRANWREFWLFSLPRAMSGVFAVLIQQAGVLLLGALATSAQAGIFAAATRYLVLGNAVQGAILKAFQPLVTTAIAIKDRSEARQLFQTATAWTTLLTWPIYLTIAVHAETLLRAFGQGYGEGRAAMVILAVAWLVGTALGPVDAVLVMAGRSSLSMLNLMAALIANLLLSVALIPRFGSAGAALAWLVGILVHNLLPLWQVWRSLQLHPFGRSTLLSLGASTLCFGVLGWLLRSWLGGAFLQFALAGAVAASTYVLILYLLRRSLGLDLLAQSIHQRLAGQGPGNGGAPRSSSR